MLTESNTSTYDQDSYILIVDDDQTLLKFFKIHLNKFFSKVLVVKNAKEAIAAIKDKEKVIDLLITDIRMPHITGLELMKKVKSYDPSIPVLIISGALLDPEKEKEACSADGYLRKPFTVDALHDFIENGMKKRETIKELASLVPNKKQLKDLLQGKRKLKSTTNKDDFEKAKELFDSLDLAG